MGKEATVYPGLSPILEHHFTPVCVCCQAVEVNVLKYLLGSSKTITVKMIVAAEHYCLFPEIAALVWSLLEELII